MVTRRWESTRIQKTAARVAEVLAIDPSLRPMIASNATTIEELSELISAFGTVVQLKGTWDASTGSFPGSGAALAGWSYLVTGTGAVGGVAFTTGDRLIAIADNASTSTYASNWYKADYTDLVQSVAGRTGAVVLTMADVGDAPVAVGSLGTATAGKRAMVNDANATTFASIVAGGGANVVPVYADGTNWRIG